MTSTPDNPVASAVMLAVNDAVERLERASVPTIRVAEFVPARRVWGITRRARLVPLGTAWPLGVFLLDDTATLWAAGQTTRAVEPGYPGHVSQSAELRREYRAAAFLGPFEPGETIAFDAQPITLTDDALTTSVGPLFVRDGVARVRWSRTIADAAAREFSSYLAERVSLAVDPPTGA